MITVRKSVKGVRSFCVGGILRNLTFTEESKKSFMDLQDKLHHGLGKQRKLVSMGTHDLDKIQGPFEFTAMKVEDIKFKPLNLDREMTCAEIIEHYNEDSNMRDYTQIVPEDCGVYPVIKDSRGEILSMPPLINSDLSKIETTTKNVFIELTAKDETKALMALNVMVTLFGMYSETPFTFQQMKIVYEHDAAEDKVTPNFDLERDIEIRKEYIERLLGQGGVTDQMVVENLLKMGLETKIAKASDEANENNGLYSVHIPLHRTDVLHQCDVAEDFAIAYGYNNINITSPEVVNVGKGFKLNTVTEKMRSEIAIAGYAECMTFVLCSVADLTTDLLREKDDQIVHIGNPKASDFEAGRTTLLPGLLKCLNANKNNKLPLKFFEISDVMLRVPDAENLSGFWGQTRVYDKSLGAINQRRLGVVRSNVKSSELAETHGCLDYIFQKMYLSGRYTYKLKKGKNPFLFRDLQADIYLYDNENQEFVNEKERIGYLGIVHPEILKRLKWSYPVSCLEITFELLSNLLL